LVRNLFIDDEPQPGSAAVQIGEPFALVTQNGAPITDQDLLGHPSLMFFGYRYCPDVCPTALTDVSGWLAELGAEASDLAVYFVTVDPERDQPEQLAEYLTAFDPRIVGVTGPVDDVHAMLDGYHVYYERQDTTGGSYEMEHYASFFMLDRNGEFAGSIDYNATRDEALGRIRQLIAAR
jgi:protein SCO1/2